MITPEADPHLLRLGLSADFTAEKLRQAYAERVAELPAGSAELEALRESWLEAPDFDAAKRIARGGKLKLKGDWVTSRGRTTQSVEPNGVTTPGFPTAWSAVDAFKFQAIYQLQDNLSLITHAWVEKYSAQDWHLDGVWPSTVPNFLAFGQQSPAANVKAIAASLRFRF